MAIANEILRLNGGYDEALRATRGIAQGIGGTIDKIRGERGKSPSAIRDLNTNGFLSQNSQFKPDFFIRAFDEPTYLTFRIEFMNKDIDQLDRNIAYNNNSIREHAMTSAFYNKMYDYMPEPFLEGYNVATGSGEDASVGKTYSTECYLDMNLGDHGRAQMLHTFKLALEDIQKNFPFYFKSISGLSSLSKVDPKQGARLKDAKITIECLEGLDLKITQLLNLYKKIVWDDVYQRWILPDMMRYFGMKIYVSEIRLFQDRKKESETSSQGIYDFTDSAVRNATTFPLDASEKWRTNNNALNTATAVSNAFLGTKSIITRALNYTEGTLSTIGDVFNTIANSINDIQYCNNAINEVMPTICYECHMCEFDIADIMNYLDSLSSSNKTDNPVPKITIKVGQVKEQHSYPLNTSLRANDVGYFKTIRDYINDSSINAGDSFYSVYNSRNERNGLMFAGNFISDNTLNRRYTEKDLNNRVNQYVNYLGHDMGDVKAQTINLKRQAEPLRDVGDNMTYSKNSTTQSLADTGLVAAALNEATTLGRMSGVNKEIVGTNSLALNQLSHIKEAVRAVGEAINEAADRIYNGEDIHSMALSDKAKAQVANDLFAHFIDNLELSTATAENTVLHEFLKNYKVIAAEENNSNE